MIELHQYPGCWGLPSSSPFCIKVETYLRIAQIPYRIVWENNPRRGPKGKMPFIKDQDTVVADSAFIIKYLQKKYHCLDQHLDEQQQAVMRAFQKLVEENLYWVLLHSRWGDHNGWKAIQKEFLSFFPPLVGKVILKIIRRNLLKQAYQQGIGRHSHQQIYEIGIEDLKAIAIYLQQKTFFFGEKPCSLDCTIYSFLITILRAPIPCPLKECVEIIPEFQRYCQNITSNYFLDQHSPS